MKYLIILSFFVFTLPFHRITAQEKKDDRTMIREIFYHALTNSYCYDNLSDLCFGIGHRLSGSPEAARAVQWGKEVLQSMPLDTVYLQKTKVPHWQRGNKENARLILSTGESRQLGIASLGGSVGTGPDGLEAGVIEVKNKEELKKLGKEKIRGKIVFLNHPMNSSYINSFRAYGESVRYRHYGTSMAAPYGAKAVLVRSMTTYHDNVPHTGSQHYKKGVNKIPAAAISIEGAELLSNKLKKDPGLKIRLEMDCKNLEEKTSHNVIGEIRGSEFPKEVIVVSGHLDSWDKGQGAHDDGAGCVQAIEVMNLLYQVRYRPKRTIRCVLYMNEENGTRGAKTYARWVENNGETPLAALESDRGAFTPRGFSVDGTKEVEEKALKRLQSWKELFKPYYLHYFETGHASVDIGYLKDQNTALFGLFTDPQRYFIYHHSSNDTFDAVNKRELEMGAGAMTALTYLLDKYGLEKKKQGSSE